MATLRNNVEIQEAFTWQPYRIKPLAVWAMRMNRDFECRSLECVLLGKSGDWMVRGDDGWIFPVAHEVFQRYYVKREWKKTNETQTPKGNVQSAPSSEEAPAGQSAHR